jgi:DNA-directed RNA polymerase specialized sigma24 family protein
LYGIARNLLVQHYRRGRVETAARKRLGIACPAPHDDDLDAILARLDAQVE